MVGVAEFLAVAAAAPDVAPQDGVTPRRERRHRVSAGGVPAARGGDGGRGDEGLGEDARRSTVDDQQERVLLARLVTDRVGQEPLDLLAVRGSPADDLGAAQRQVGQVRR